MTNLVYNVIQRNFSQEALRIWLPGSQGCEQLFRTTEVSAMWKSFCFFSRVDCEKCLVGRVVQCSYLTGSKKQRQYSSDYVDLTKDSCKNIGVLTNWFQGTQAVSGSKASGGLVPFKPIENVFTPGYLPMKHYVGSIDESSLRENLEFSFSISVQVIQKALPNWKSELTFDFN